jgi:hypothetical protein
VVIGTGRDVEVAAGGGVCVGEADVLDDTDTAEAELPSPRPNNCRRSRRRLLLESTESRDGDLPEEQAAAVAAVAASVKADDKIMDPPPGIDTPPVCAKRPPGRKAGDGGLDGFGVDAIDDVLDVGVDDVTDGSAGMAASSVWVRM